MFSHIDHLFSFDHSCIFRTSFFGIPNDIRNSLCAFGARCSNSACHLAIDDSSMPAASIIITHIFLSTIGLKLPLVIFFSMAMIACCWPLRNRIWSSSSCMRLSRIFALGAAPLDKSSRTSSSDSPALRNMQIRSNLLNSFCV